MWLCSGHSFHQTSTATLISSVSTQSQNGSEVYCFWKETLGQKHFSHLHMCQLGKSLLLKALNSFFFFFFFVADRCGKQYFRHKFPLFFSSTTYRAMHRAWLWYRLEAKKKLRHLQLSSLNPQRQFLHWKMIRRIHRMTFSSKRLTLWNDQLAEEMFDSPQPNTLYKYIVMLSKVLVLTVLSTENDLFI